MRRLVGTPGPVAGCGRFDLVEVLPGRRGVVAGDAGAAEALRREADRAGDGLDREVAQALGSEFPGQALLGRDGDAVAGQVDERGGKQLVLTGHVDTIVARRDDRGTGD